MKIYPILNNLGKGKYVFIFILNERAVAKLTHCINFWESAADFNFSPELELYNLLDQNDT